MAQMVLRKRLLEVKRSRKKVRVPRVCVEGIKEKYKVAQKKMTTQS